MLRTLGRILVCIATIAACSSSDPAGADGAADVPGGPSPDPGEGPGAAADAPAGSDPDTSEDPGAPPATCAIAVTDAAPVSIGKATEAGEHALLLAASSADKTSWAETDNEAVVLEIARGAELVGHLVLHQGKARFEYGMHVGALKAGDELTARVSELTAPNATKRACIEKATLRRDTSEGVVHAPILEWPRQKSFDDLPMLVGWSKGGKSYQIVYSNENGGTCKQCGGGAKGLRSEIARWGRAFDIEGAFGYGGAGRFARCTGAVAPSAGSPRMEADHPVLYYGDGHNRVFESRGGYGQTCGTGGPERADGSLQGWNVNNPGNEADKDGPYTIVIRPLPVDLDALDYRKYAGRREAVVDTYAPWLYRITWSEAQREGKIDGTNTFALSRYLFVDIYADDVNGRGDETCGFFLSPVQGGFRLRIHSKDGETSDGPQMTSDYFGGGPGVKRIAVPLAKGVAPSDIDEIVFDAYDGDGIYWLALGDAFVAQPQGDNGAKIQYVHKGKTAVNVFVDDDDSSCQNGKNTRGGVSYPCAGSAYTLTLP